MIPHTSSTTARGTMRAFALDKFGVRGSVRRVPVPALRNGEILIRIRAAGVNPIDMYLAMGTLGKRMKYHFPLVPGIDAAGVVEQVGAGVSQWIPGDEVFGQFNKPIAGEGTYADYVVVPASGTITRKPPSMDFTQAAALPTPGLAALEAVNAVAPGQGDVVLIVGAPGGVGSYAVQMAALREARVIATGRPEQEDYLFSLGADDVIDYTNHDVVDTVTLQHPLGIKGLIDVVSQDPAAFRRNALVLQLDGRAATTRGVADHKSLTEEGVQGTNVMAGVQTGSQGLRQLAAMVQMGELRVPIAHVYSLEDVPVAFERLRSGSVEGKLVLVPEKE